MRETLGMRAVGVELYLVVSDVADRAEKILEVGLKQRLAAADADALEDTLALAEMRKHLVDGIALGASRIENEGRIMAEGATQIASAREDGASGKPGVVK